MTREQAAAILAEREGTPPEQIEGRSDAEVIAAAEAPAGQPCSDCGKVVVWRENEDLSVADWYHVEMPTACFLARSDER